jgi:hypothetical protein
MITSCWILLRMRNVSNKSCRENQNTHFMFDNPFPKIAPFFRQYRKMWWSQRGPRWQFRGASHAELVRLHAKHTPVLVLPHPQQYIYFCFSTATMTWRTCLSVALYVRCFPCSSLGGLHIFSDRFGQLHVSFTLYRTFLLVGGSTLWWWGGLSMPGTLRAIPAVA